MKQKVDCHSWFGKDADYGKSVERSKKRAEQILWLSLHHVYYLWIQILLARTSLSIMVTEAAILDTFL